MEGRDFSAELFGAPEGRDFGDELFGPAPQESVFRQVADVPLGVAKGAVQGVRMIADAFGAGSDTSKVIKSAEDYLGGLMSAAAKKDQAEIQRLMKDAEDKGVLEQVKAGFQAFATAPVDMLSQAFGTAVPVILATVGSSLLGGGVGVATGVSALTGAGMGAGVVKGSIYEATKQALIEAGAQPDEAEKRAQLAQEYGGKNLDQILLGTVLGGVAAVGPLEKGAAGALARRILGKVSGEEAAETAAEQAAKGALRRRAEAAGLEAVPEAVQAGQEQAAQNIALQREGFEVPTMRGVAGAATLEGLAGAGLGAVAGGRRPAPPVEPEVEPPAPEAPPAEPPVISAGALEYRPDPYFELPDGSVAKQSEIDAYLATLPEDQQAAIRAKMRPVGRPPERAPRPTMEGYPDKSVATREAAEAYIQKLPEDQRVAARARLLGLAPQPGTEFSPQEIAELEKQQAKAKRKPTAEELIAKARIKTGKPTTERDVTRIRDEYETAVIEGLLAQDAEMQRANELANIQREELAPQVEAEPDVLGPAIADVDQRVREGRIMARVQDLIDRNIPFASTAITDINNKLSVINEAPLSNEERNRIQNIMGMVNVFTGFVNLPQLPARPVDTRAENQAMEALIKERKERGPTEPLRATPVAPSPRVEEAPFSQGVGEGAALRPPSGVEPSVAEDRELVTPAPVAPTTPPAPTAEAPKKGDFVKLTVPGVGGPINRAGKVEQVLPNGDVEVRTQQGEIVSKPAGEVTVVTPAAPKAEAPIVEAPAAPAKPARVAKPRKAPGSIMGSPMLAGIFNQLGGLHTSLLSEFSTRFFTKNLDKKGRPIIRFRNPLVSGRGSLFNKNGKVDFTEIAEYLEQEGYLEPGSVERDYKEAGERAKDLIKRALNKEEVLTIQEQIEKDSREAQEAARQAQLEREEENRMIAAGEMELEPEFDWTDEEFRENLGFDKQFEEDLDVYNLEPEDLRFLTDEELESELTDAEREQAQARRTRKAEEDARRKAAEVPAPREDETFLTTQSEEELRERDKVIRQKEYEEKLKEAKARTAERKEREQRDVKARALETVDDFELGRTAEEQMSGMRDMFEEPAKPARVGTDAQIKSADEHAASIGGTVVYQDGDIALARGYSILTGDPVYSVINGNYRSKIDVRSYTGNLITPEQKNELVKIRDDLEAKDKEAFDSNPSVKFDDGLAFSKGIPKEIKGIIQGWRELLGLKGNLYVTTVDDARANRDNFNGPHRAISSAGLSDNEAGSFRMLANGDYYIAFRPSTSKTRMLEVIAHELGHMHEREVFKNADADTQQKIRDEHSKWLKSQTGQTAEQLIKSLRAKTTGKTTRIEKGMMADELRPYWKSFGEWYADQVSKWATTSEKPVSVVEKFFSRLGKALRNFYNKLTNQGYLPNETFVQYLEKAHQFPARLGPSGPMEPQAMVKQVEPAGIRAKVKKKGEEMVAEAREIGQKRKLDKGAFEGVNEDLFEKLKPIFAPRNRTIQDRIIDMRDNFWQRVAQGMADQFRTIKEYSYDAYMKARLSKSIDGGLEGLMFYGQVFNDDGALNIKKNTRGMFDILKPVGKELDRYLIYIALSRDAALPEGKRSIDPDLVARRGELIEGTLNGKPRKEVYEQVRKDMNLLNRSVLKVAVDSGLLNTTEGAIKDIEANENLTDEQKREKIAELRKNPIGYERFINDLNYIPFYKIMEDGDTDAVAKAVSASGLTSQYFSKALKGGEKPFGDLMENTLKNWSHILSASMKNQAAVATMDAAVKAGVAVPNLKPQYDFVDGKVVFRKNGEVVGDGSIRADMTESEKGAVKIVVDGKNTYYNVSDPLLMDSITSIGFLGTQSKFLDVARDFKNLLQYGVTISPQFRVNNLIRDAVGAMGVSELRLNPVANVLQGVSLSDRNSPTYIAAMAGGGIFNFGTAYEGDQSKMIKRLLKMGVDRDHILDSDSKIATGLKYAWDKYQEWGNKAENANRLALYQQLRDKGMSHLEATFKARDLMDFSMQGSWPAFRVLTQVIPFLNARVQGLYKLGRDGISPTARVINNTITGKPIEASDKQKAQQFSIVLMGVTLASALLYLTFKDDEEYKRRDDWDKDNFWWFRVPGMEFALRVPKPFEIGAIGTVVERTLEQILDSGAEGKEFGNALFRMLTNTFAINPIPQAFKPLVDIYANKDSFTGAPIESAGLERLSKQERMVDTTSPLAIALGKVSSLFPETFEISPVQADYLIKGYLGWLGGTIAATSTYATMPFKEGEYPDARWMDRLSLGLARELPGRGAKFVTAFYESNKEIAQAYADMRHYAAIGDSQKVQELLEEKGDKIRLAKFYDNVATQMANIRKQIRLTQNDKLMDGAAKKEAIDRMQDMIAMLAKQAEDIRKQQKGGRP